MKLLLLNPFQVTTAGYNYQVVLNKGQYVEAPLGLGYISSYCKRHMDLDVKMLDAHIFAIDKIVGNPKIEFETIENEILDIICSYNPDIIGVSCLFHVLAKNAHRFIARIKAKISKVKVVMGGSYPTASPEHALQDRNIDFVVIGEGEHSMLRILKYYNKDLNLEDLDGVGYMENNKVVIKPALRIVSDINEFGVPERDDSYFKKYTYLGRHFFEKTKKNKEDLIATMTASRGCPFDCTFCISINMWHRRIRFRNVNAILDEISTLKDEYGMKYMVFNDDNLTVNRAFAIELCKGIIKRGFNIKWSISGGFYVRSLDKEIVEVLVRSGCDIFNLAIESGSEEILMSIRKKITREDVIRTVDLLRKFGVYVGGYFMLGFPEETKEQFQSTIDFSSDLDLDWRTYQCVQPYPGTELYKECLKKGLLEKEFIEDFEVLDRRNYVIKPVHLSRDYVLLESYIANLRYNFLSNRNLIKKNGNLEIAIRDFEWVLNMVTDHVVAAYCLSTAYEKLGNSQKASFYKNKSMDLAKDKKIRKKYHLDKLNLNLCELEEKDVRGYRNI